MDIINYLKRNLKPDADIDLTEEVLEYVAKLEKKAKSLDKIRNANKKYIRTPKGKAKRESYRETINRNKREKYHQTHPTAKHNRRKEK